MSKMSRLAGISAWFCFRPPSSLTSQPRSDSPMTTSSQPTQQQQHDFHSHFSACTAFPAPRSSPRPVQIHHTKRLKAELSRPCRSSTSSSSASCAPPSARRAGSSPRAASTSCEWPSSYEEAPCTSVKLTSRLWRSSSLLTIVCCYLMWSVTYLAQLHPLVGEYSPALYVVALADMQHPNAEISDTPTARDTTSEPAAALDQPNRRPYVYYASDDGCRKLGNSATLTENGWKGDGAVSLREGGDVKRLG